MILDRPLPTTCYWSDRILLPTGIGVHFISARNTKPSAPYDPDAIFNIFVTWRVSAHALVLRSGDIWLMVPENKPAWHAGKSRFRGINGLNMHWLGIEFVGDGENDFEDVQYREGAFLVRDWMNRFGIPSNRVKGHEQVSGPRVRQDYKEDPGVCFDWIHFGHLVLRG